MVKELFIHPTDLIKDALVIMNERAKGILLIVDQEEKLLGTMTDGDIRRAILAGQDLNEPVTQLLPKKAGRYKEPITASVGTDFDTMLNLLRENVIRHLPILDPSGRVVDLITWEDLVEETHEEMYGMIMAGGTGSRLRPLTQSIPKPMLPIGDRPVMEYIVDQFFRIGIRRIYVSTHFMPEAIIGHFGSGEKFGVNFHYVNEEIPLGTAGCLGLLPNIDRPLVCVNGDILTNLDVRAMFAFHKTSNSPMTVAVRDYSVQIEYGVVDIQNLLVRAVREKPRINQYINAGIYIVEPQVLDYVPKNKEFNMTDLIQALIGDGQQVSAYPVLEYWLDIGQLKDYQQGEKDIKDGKLNSKAGL